MTRGNQRELARQKNQQKQKENQKKSGSKDKAGNKGLTLEERRQSQTSEKEYLSPHTSYFVDIQKSLTNIDCLFYVLKSCLGYVFIQVFFRSISFPDACCLTWLISLRLSSLCLTDSSYNFSTLFSCLGRFSSFLGIRTT
ncbi:hypothetical protein TcWFU_009096 [Taenia crassiceps]|uniref:Small EDRK-rich factor-like N-terminal domain-containing protein n=1 Tax=Taenia crassiceps TaxID=6207 RepID=A0ABR4QM47_9CEST